MPVPGDCRKGFLRVLEYFTYEQHKVSKLAWIIGDFLEQEGSVPGQGLQQHFPVAFQCFQQSCRRQRQEGKSC